MQDAADRNTQTMGADRDAWVEDLFERIYETVSLLNVDRYQSLAITLPPDQLRAVDLDQGQRLPNNIAMGGRDAIRDEDYSIAPATPNNPLPLSEHAKTRHRALSDLQNLKLLVALQPNRLRSLIRQVFQVEAKEAQEAAQVGFVFTSMRMPPFMRNSSGGPLTLSSWQYELLMKWADELVAAGPAIPAAGVSKRELTREPGAAGIAARAASRRADVLARLDQAPAGDAP